MKNLVITFIAALLFLFALPNQAQAQCPTNADTNPCFSLPMGPCVCYPAGKLRFWVAVSIIEKAKPALDQENPGYSFSDYLIAYYLHEEMTITYLGGSWAAGQSFRVEMGGGVIIVVIDGDL
ncbi:MAG TPA: hypothetical protein ENJ82_01310 [Bacteroidetes bacterium]|nr:hypothetical protein [Bacteroidota bacterium]